MSGEEHTRAGAATAQEVSGSDPAAQLLQSVIRRHWEVRLNSPHYQSTGPDGLSPSYFPLTAHPGKVRQRWSVFFAEPSYGSWF